MKARSLRRPFFVALVVLMACMGCTTAPEIELDVQSQREDYKAISLPWLRYVEADPLLDEPAKARRRNTVATQDLRIRMLEEAIQR